MATGAPTAITDQIRAFCHSIVPAGEPRFVTVAPSPGNQTGECFPNVRKKVARDGGRIVFGWAIWEWPRVFVEAEHHAIYEGPDGKRLDITPPPAEGANRILFLSDETAIYDFENEGVRRDNFRLALSDDPRVPKMFDTARMIAEIWNSVPGMGMVSISPQQKAQLQALVIENERLTYELGMRHTPQNARCFCGSDKKFKHCHGQPQRGSR